MSKKKKKKADGLLKRGRGAKGELQAFSVDSRRGRKVNGVFSQCVRRFLRFELDGVGIVRLSGFAVQIDLARNEILHQGAEGGVLRDEILRHVPIETVVEVRIVVRRGEDRQAKEQTGEKSADNRHGQGENQSGTLITHLHARGSLQSAAETPAGQILRVERTPGHRRHDDAGQTGDDAGHAVQIVNTARVVNANLFQDVQKIFVAQRGDHPRDTADEHCSEQIDVLVGHCSHRHSSGQCGILNVNDFLFALADEGRNDEGQNDRGTDADVSVDDRAKTSVSHCCARVERRPKAEEKQSADHREDVRRVTGTLLVGLHLAIALQSKGRGQTEVRPEDVNEDRSTRPQRE